MIQSNNNNHYFIKNSAKNKQKDIANDKKKIIKTMSFKEKIQTRIQAIKGFVQKARGVANKFIKEIILFFARLCKILLNMRYFLSSNPTKALIATKKLRGMFKYSVDQFKSIIELGGKIKIIKKIYNSIRSIFKTKNGEERVVFRQFKKIVKLLFRITKNIITSPLIADLCK